MGSYPKQGISLRTGCVKPFANKSGRLLPLWKILSLLLRDKKILARNTND